MTWGSFMISAGVARESLKCNVYIATACFMWQSMSRVLKQVMQAQNEKFLS